MATFPLASRPRPDIRGHTTGAWDESGPPPKAESLVQKLSADLPHYVLPSAVGAHTRHYMPIGGLDSAKLEKTTLVFDTWLRIREELVATWPHVQLNDEEMATLALLAGRLNYLGRSESWVEARVVGCSEQIAVPNCVPEQDEPRRGADREQVDLLAPESASDYSVWRRTKLDEALAKLPLPVAHKPSKALLNRRAKAESPYPRTLLECLQKDTNWLRSHGWSRPPGSRRVVYARPSGAISVSAPRSRIVAARARRVEAMLLSMAVETGHDHVLPPVTRTLLQAELLHRALVGIAARNGAPPHELTGRDRDGRPLKGAHEHAHIHPLDLDGDGHLDHVLIWAPGGLGTDAQRAIRRARRTFTKGFDEPIRMALVGTGDVRDLARLPGAYGRRMARIADRSTVWESMTPFVPPRHIKARGRNTLDGQIRAELLSRRLPPPADVHFLLPAWTDPTDASPTTQEGASNFRHFVCSRQRGPKPPVDCGFAIRLEFREEIPGPIAIGYGAHFGLGLFAQFAHD